MEVNIPGFANQSSIVHNLHFTRFFACVVTFFLANSSKLFD